MDFQKRLPIYFLMDCSGSMRGEKITAVTQGMNQLFTQWKLQNAAISVSVITFSSTVEQMIPLTKIEQMQMLNFPVNGATMCGKALLLLSECLQKEVRQKSNLQPLIFLFTDGSPSDMAIFQQNARKVNQLLSAKIFAFAIGENQNFSFLNELTEQVKIISQIPEFFAFVEQEVNQIFPAMKPKRKIIPENHFKTSEKRPEKNSEKISEKSYEELAALAPSVVMIGIHDKTGEMIGSGSGIAISKKGYILTNCHVVSQTGILSVKLENQEKIFAPAEMIKYHSLFDLAIIRIPCELSPLNIYQNAKELVRGQKCVAIGSPLGLFNSVSDGIISGFRKIEHTEFIQFTAPISSGSSGGALLNMYGEVIGMTTSKIGGGENINLAVNYKHILPFVKPFLD